MRCKAFAGAALVLLLALPASASPEMDGSPALDASEFVPQHSDDGLRFRGALPATDAAQLEEIDPIVKQLRNLTAAKLFEQLVPRKADREAIAAFYQASDKPLWIEAGGPSESAKISIEHLRGVAADGLDSRDYPIPDLAVSGAQAQAENEIRFTATLLTYARHALTGRVAFSRVSANIEYKPAFDPAQVLKTLVTSDDIGRTLDRFNPQAPAYLALKSKLAELRHAPVDRTPPRFANGPVLRTSANGSMMADPRVPKLRARFGIAAEPNQNYDQSLAAAVAKFQAANGFEPTGQLNAMTLEALNGPRRSRQIDAILATMERWRWMPRDLGHTHVVLNIADYTLRVYHDGAKVWQTRVVVGKPTSPTPLLTETMKFITVNPTWHVPQSIIQNELLPVYETTDPQIFEQLGLTVERGRDGRISVSQPPGERNALGRIRFNFPNKFSVYQHDTPEKHYFARERRAYSHGCMRVQDPAKYAEVLASYASPQLGLTEARIKQMYGGPEQQIDLRTPVPVHITYQTAFVDERGKLQLRDDIYGHDARILSLLQAPERATADVAVKQRPAGPNLRPIPSVARRLESAARGEPAFSPFERIFR